MAKLSEIRAAIINVLGESTGGHFLKSQKNFKSAKDVKEVYGDSILGGFIELVKRKEIAPYTGRGQVFYTWRITYLRAITEESQEQHEDSVEDLIEAFTADTTLAGVVNDLRDQEENVVSLNSIEPVMYLNVLCHRAQLTLTTEVLG